jgi:hypothetical protein
MERRRRVAALLVVLAAATLVVGAQAVTADRSVRVVTAENGSFDGATLLSIQPMGGEGEIRVLAPDGTEQWRWGADGAQVTDAEQLPGGGVLVALSAQVTGAACPPAVRTGDRCLRNRVVELGADSLDASPQVVWTHTWFSPPGRDRLGTDADRLESGATLVTDRTADEVFLLSADGARTWTWNATARLGPGSDFHEAYGGPEATPDGWAGVADADAFGDTVVVTLRGLGTVVTVDRESGAVEPLVGRPGTDTLVRPTDAHHLGDTVLVADPGQSRVVEYTPEGERVWTYGGSALLRRPTDVDRLPNGNTLITDATAGRVAEIAPDGDTVWALRSPWRVDSADRLGVSEEPDAAGSGWTLENRTREAGPVLSLVRYVESTTRFVLPVWVGPAELAAGLVGVLAALLLTIEALVRLVVRLRHA